MAVQSRLAAAFAALVLLAGCGGGGGATPPAGSSAGGASLGGRTPTKISFVIPSASHTSSRRRNTLPSSTQSVVLTFTGPYGSALTSAVAPVVINTSSCTTVSTGLQCTTTADLPLGAVVGSVAAYAGASGAGALLALGTLTLNVAAGTTAAVTLTTASNYQLLAGNSLSATLSIDHVANTFTVNTTTGTGAAEIFSGTIAPLPNGDIEATVTNNGGSSAEPVGDIILVRELPDGAIMLEDSQTVSPPSPWDGSTTTGGAGFGVANAACASTAGTFPIDLVSISGQSFTPAGTNASQALIVGSAQLTSTTLVGGGTAYDINGNSLGSTTSGTVTCSGNVYAPPGGSQNQPTLAFNNLGVIVGANGNSGGGSSSDVIGVVGFANPASVSLATLASLSYDGFLVTGNGSGTNAEPLNATPAGGGLQLCPYTDILNNVVATGSTCVTLTLTSQPYPGVVYGTVSSGDVVVLTVAQVNGKYALLGIADVGSSTSAGTAGNFILFQH